MTGVQTCALPILPLNLRYIGAGTELEVQVRRGKVKKINKKTKKKKGIKQPCAHSITLQSTNFIKY